ncbi:MAG: DUF3857 domain-containing protein [Bacteroidales bacterium]|nr:DUF3857 domain-containing protein [Bacteroidales bacterium]
MKKIIALLLLTGFFLSNGMAQEPATDATFISVLKEYTLNADGSSVFRNHHRLKLNTHRAFHNLFGESFIVYNPDFQSLKVNKSLTTMADGKKVPSPSNAYNEVLPSFAAGSPYHAQLKEMVVTHTALEVGAEIELDYSIITKAGALPFLMGNELGSLAANAQEYTVVVRVPKGTVLNHRMLNLRLGPEITTEKDMDVYTWKFGKQPALSHDNFLPAETDYLPFLTFTTAPSLQAATEWFTSQPSFNQLAVSQDMAMVVKTALAFEKDDLSRVLKLRNMVVNDVALLRVPLKYDGFKARNIEDVWNSNSGTQLEKSLLLCALLRSAGYKAQMIARIPSKLYTRELGNLLDIDGFILRVSLPESGDIWISATNSSSNDLFASEWGNTLLLLEAAAESVKTWIPELPENSIRVKGVFDVGSDLSMTGKATVDVKGTYYPYFDVLSDRENAKSFLSGSFAKAFVKEVNIKRMSPLKLESEYTIINSKALNELSNGYFQWEFPVAVLGVSKWTGNLFTTKRTAPFQIPTFALEVYEYQINLPEDVELMSRNMKMEIKKEFGNVVLEIKADGRKIMVKRVIEFVVPVIDPMQYSELREVLIGWNTKMFTELTFKRK